jgi:hypothetical protein
MSAMLDTLASFAFLVSGVIFFSSGMDHPEPARSAAATIDASFQVCSTNFSKAGPTVPLI